MLRPIYDQKSRLDGRMSPELRRVLQWWVQVLQSGLCEKRAWHCLETETVQLFCDASGYPAYLGAVLLLEDKCYFTHLEPPVYLLEQFKSRRDNQIMGLELLSISLGLSTFNELIRGRNVVIHSDNTGSEACRVHLGCGPHCTFGLWKAAIRRGTAVSMDHAQLVHAQWTQAAKLQLGVHVLRVLARTTTSQICLREGRLICFGLQAPRKSNQFCGIVIGKLAHGRYCRSCGGCDTPASAGCIRASAVQCVHSLCCLSGCTQGCIA